MPRHDGTCIHGPGSHRGHTSLPAALRHRWGIDDGGEVTIIDLGDAALVIRGGSGAGSAELRRALQHGGYGRGVALIDDPNLAGQ